MCSKRLDADESPASVGQNTPPDEQTFPFPKDYSDHNTSHSDIEEVNGRIDSTFAMDTEDNEEAFIRSRELKAVEEEKIRRARAEAQHDEDLNNLRIRRMRETQPIAAQALEMAHQSTQEIQQQMSRASRRGRDVVPKQTDPPWPHWEISSGGIQSSRFYHRTEIHSEHLTIPQFKRTDSEVFATPTEEPSPPPTTQWRYPQRQRSELNLDFSRIDTQYLLAHEFVDDVNIMLDFIDGWFEFQFEDIKYAFQEDSDNRGRIIQFVDLGNRRWGVQLLDPLKPLRRDSGMHCPFASFENPLGRCQSFGRDQVCPNRKYMEQRVAELKEIRQSQDLQPPPLPPRSNKRKAPSRPPGIREPLLPPITPESLMTSSRAPDSPRPGFRQLSDTDMETEYIEGLEHSEMGLMNQADQMKTYTSQFKKQTGDTGAGGRKSVQMWLQKSNFKSSPVKIAARLPSIDRVEFGSIGGQLVHDEKIPTGPDSLRSTDLSFTSRTDIHRTLALGPLVDQIQNKPREEYYATETTNSIESDGETNTFMTSSLPPWSEHSPAEDGVQTVTSDVTPITEFRPQYLSDPVAY